MAGYLAACLIVVVGIGVTLLGESFLAHFYFSVSFLMLATLLAALFWGLGPGLLAALLSCVTFGVFSLLPPTEPGSMPLSWEIFFRLLPFSAASLVAVVITGQREAARQLMQKRTEELLILNQQLEQVNQLKNHFLTRAAHELRTPLTTILGEAQLALSRLNRQEGTVASCQRSFAKIEARARNLRTLIERLLEISILHSRETSLQFAACDFSEICREVIEVQQAQSKRQIISHLPEQALILQADREQLSHVVTNLVENAIHYSAPQTSICVSLRREPAGALLQVTNEGPELSSEQQKRIFEPFYRTSFGENAFQDGWGLGLTVSKEIIEQHHGRIWIASGQDKGTTFFVSLPFQYPDPPSS